MYEYKFVRIESGGYSNSGKDSDYHFIVEQYANQGWRLVQLLILPIFDGYSMTQQVELIFERQKDFKTI